MVDPPKWVVSYWKSTKKGYAQQKDVPAREDGLSLAIPELEVERPGREARVDKVGGWGLLCFVFSFAGTLT